MRLNQVSLFISCITFSAFTFASTSSTSPSSIKASNNQIGVRILSTHVDYTETGNGILGTPTGTLNTEKNQVPGFGMSLSLMKKFLFNNDYIEAEYDHSTGYTNYVGSFNGGVYGSVLATSSAKLTNYSLRAGEGFDVSDNVMLTPFIEIGHHKWERGVNYGEIYVHNYYGVGALGQYSLNNNLVLSANAMIGNTSGSKLSVAGPYGFDTSLGNSSMYMLGISGDYAFKQNIHANLGVDYARFKYGISALVTLASGIFVEPDSQTRYMIVKIGLGFAF